MEQNVNFCGISGQLKNKKEERREREMMSIHPSYMESQTQKTEPKSRDNTAFGREEGFSAVINIS